MEHFTKNPGYEVAVKIAEELKKHCKMFNIPEDAVIAGVALNAELAYIKGKEAQKDHIRAILGL